MTYLVSAMLLVVAVIHLLPLAGVLGSERLAQLYGVELADPNLVVLMRHRAVLFGILGVFFACAAFRQSWQPLAFAAGFASVLSFLALAKGGEAINLQLTRVAMADWLALACLVCGLGAFLLVRVRN